MFSGGRVDFSLAQFSGGRVDFGMAEFTGGEVDFGMAEFTGGEVDFSLIRDWSVPPKYLPTGTPTPGVKLPEKQDKSQA